jgi:hypothetical protein
MKSFFGYVSPGISQPERFPPSWTNRLTSYTTLDMAEQIVEMYLKHPVLFGGNVGPGNFDALGTVGPIVGGRLGGEGGNVDAKDVACFLFQLYAT